jgi:hypothetical protein
MRRAEPTHHSLNPLATGGTPLPPNVLLAAKLVTLVFFLLGAWRLTIPYLPFIGFLDDLGSPQALQHTLQAVWLLAALSLFMNRFVRPSCAVLGVVILIAMLSSHAYRSNNLMFTGLLLFLIGMSDRETASMIIRAQFVVLYFWAGVNKLLDPDWRSGAFFEIWNSIAGWGELYRGLASLLPAMVFSAVLSWGAIVTELFLAVAFAVRRLVIAGILVAVAYHSSILFVTGDTFTMFWYAVLAACIALLEWPANPPSVHYRADGLLGGITVLLHKLDLAGAFTWERNERSGLRIVIGERVYNGRDALARVLLYNPTVYFTFFTLVALAPAPAGRRWAALIVFGAVGYAVINLVKGKFLSRLEVGT